jgi:hypothetical protein
MNFWGRPHDHDRAALGRDRNDFTGNDFTAAELDGVSFRHIDLRAQRFPGLPGYALLDRVAERVSAVLPLVDGWPDGDQALVSPARMGRRLPPALREELFAAFRHTPSDTSRG